MSLARHGVESYRPTIALVRRLRSTGLKTAAVSGSENCASVFAAAGIEAARRN